MARVLTPMKLVRMRKGLTRNEVCEVIGISVGTMITIESSTSIEDLHVNISTIYKLAKYFGMTMEEYLDLKTEEVK